MSRQTRIVVRFLNQIFGAAALVIEPHQQVDGPFHVGHEHAVEILRAVEQLVLLALGGGLFLLMVAQANKTAGLFPAFGLIPELTLLVGIGAGRRSPACEFWYQPEGWEKA